MKLKLEINLDNAAFEESPDLEAANILSDLARRIREHGTASLSPTLRDTNGNTVGSWEIESEQEIEA